ncbi:26S proteasome subunit RPN8 [Pelomyxa schiedti]|nr:26S proteasome subunit RPN8 [Pelomyxa schiedti]
MGKTNDGAPPPKKPGTNNKSTTTSKPTGTEGTTAPSKGVPFSRVVVHPLVLLSTVDHYTREGATERQGRVVGVLLGGVHRGVVDVTNSFAVPADDDRNDPRVWFFDHNYVENMYAMYRKVNARENIVGWYSTGPKIRPCDIEIGEVMRRYTPHPVLVIIDVQPKDELSLPIQAYIGAEEVAEVVGEGGVITPVTTKTFQHITSDVGSFDAEEVGVEHLLRDIQDTTVGTVAQQVNHKMVALRSLESKVDEMRQYLLNVQSGRLPVNHKIVQQIQEIFNLVPNLNTTQYSKSFAVKSNDMLLAIYMSSLIRSVVALHELVLNKLEYKDAERKADAESSTTTTPATTTKESAPSSSSKKDTPPANKS